MQKNISGLAIGGRFKVECFDRFGKLRWVDYIENAFTNVGLNEVLDVMLGSVAKPNLYLLLIKDDNYTGLANGDTMASHAGWEEFQDYDETTRPAITFGAADDQVISNSTVVEFNINADNTLKGAGIVTNNVKSPGTAGILMCTGLFVGGDREAKDGDLQKVTYECTASRPA